MAIKQIVPILITLQGDGVATTFTYALANLYQAGVGGSIPFGTAGVVPSSVSVNNPALAITSSTVDANGNITITFTSAPGNGVQVTLEVDLIYNSGAASSSSATQSMNVNVTGGTITATDPFAGNTGSAVPAQAAYIGGKNAGNLVGLSVDASGNLGVNVIGAIPAGANTIGAVTQASGPWTQNLTQVGGSAIALGQTTMSASIPVAIASNQSAITVAQSTAANLNATVVGTGTFAVQAAQSGTWNIGTLTTVTNPVTVVGNSASGASNSGNPVKMGGAFNTTQPTVTNGQTVDAQFTARGAQIVATGVDTFSVSVTGTAAVTQSGTWNIGTLTSITNAVTVAQPTAANLNATVVGTGTFAVQAAATQSGNWTSRIVGNGGATLDIAQGGATAATNAVQVAGVFNSAPITLTTGQAGALQVDASGYLKVNVSAGSSGNAAASATGSAVPANAGYTGVNVAGTLRGWTAVNPSGSVFAGQIDVTSIGGSTVSTAATGILKVGIVGNAGASFDQVIGSAVPANAVQIGASDGTNIRPLSINAKGTQGALGVAVQELKDSGRTYIMWTIDAVTLVTSEALISTQVNKGGTLQGAATTYTVTSGKTLRIQSMNVTVQGTNSTVTTAKVRVRSGAAVTSSSPVVANISVSNSGASNAMGYGEFNFPDGIEIAAGQQVGVSQLGSSVNGNVTITVVGFEY